MPALVATSERPLSDPSDGLVSGKRNAVYQLVCVQWWRGRGVRPWDTFGKVSRRRLDTSVRLDALVADGMCKERLPPCARRRAPHLSHSRNDLATTRDQWTIRDNPPTRGIRPPPQLTRQPIGTLPPVQCALQPFRTAKSCGLPRPARTPRRSSSPNRGSRNLGDWCISTKPR